MRTLLRVFMVLAVVTVTGAGTPLPTGDDRPVSQFDVVLDLSVLAQAPALALLTEAEMSAVLGAGLYDDDEPTICNVWGVFADMVVLGSGWYVYTFCSLVRRRTAM